MSSRIFVGIDGSFPRSVNLKIRRCRSEPGTVVTGSSNAIWWVEKLHELSLKCGILMKYERGNRDIRQK